jgi:hypothetical protein
MAKIPDIELAWAAGFFDGEGCAGLYVHRPRRGKERLYAHIQVEQAHKEVLDRFLAAVGVGKIYGPYQRGRTHGHLGDKQIWKYTAYGSKKAQRIFDLLSPFLGSVKRDQLADLVGQCRQEALFDD